MSQTVLAAIQERRTQTNSRLEKLISRLNQNISIKFLGNHSCVYATGSVGRGEATDHSDLDLFILTRNVDGRRGLSNLGAIRLQSDLIVATEDEGFPAFSGDGEYLGVQELDKIIEHLGDSHDDFYNHFTARMLLLLESKPIVGFTAYSEIIDLVIQEYWGDFDDHQEEFIPVFLTNDILRFWKVLCLNYEASSRKDRKLMPIEDSRISSLNTAAC